MSDRSEQLENMEAEALIDPTPDTDTFWDVLEEFAEAPEEHDFEADPESAPAPSGAAEWNFEFFSKFVPRDPDAIDTDKFVRELLELMERIKSGPPEVSVDLEQELTKSLAAKCRAEGAAGRKICCGKFWPSPARLGRNAEAIQAALLQDRPVLAQKRH
jgi:hypothetical protein